MEVCQEERREIVCGESILVAVRCNITSLVEQSGVVDEDVKFGIFLLKFCCETPH